jgi:hypothetical protein
VAAHLSSVFEEPGLHVAGAIFCSFQFPSESFSLVEKLNVQIFEGPR